MTKSTVDTVILNGPVEFARVHTPRAKFNTKGSTLAEQEYSLNLLLDTPERLAAYEQVKKKFNIPDKVMGYDKVKTKDDGTPFIVLKTNAGFTDQTGNTVARTIEVVDCDTNPVPDSVLIGNGSICNVSAIGYINEKSGQGNLKLKGVQVLELVPFEGKTSFSKAKGTPIHASEIDVTMDDLGATGSDKDVF